MKIKLFGRLLVIALRKPSPRITKPTNPPPPETRASDEFWQAFSDGAGIVGTCACGRTHFALDTDLDYGKGELENLLNLRAKQPDRYLGDPYNDAIGLICLSGITIAWDCPCRTDAKYENFLVNNELRILDFFRRCRERDKRDLASREAAAVSAENDSRG